MTSEGFCFRGRRLLLRSAATKKGQFEKLLKTVKNDKWLRTLLVFTRKQEFSKGAPTDSQIHFLLAYKTFGSKEVDISRITIKFAVKNSGRILTNSDFLNIRAKVIGKPMQIRSSVPSFSTFSII